jgi:hypothetical protein
MRKVFTRDDVVEVTNACNVVGVEAVWCHVLFKGCTNPAEFLASPHFGDDFSADMYTRFKAGEFGEITHGTAVFFKTQPLTQAELEPIVIEKRNDLLLKSDYIDSAVSQARLSDEQKTAWETYRQALRDLPDQQQFPWDPVWPTKPA